MTDIFISYSHRDEDTAYELKRLLEYEGWDCWIDRPRLEIGDELEPSLNTAIVNARCVIVLLTESSLRSQWVRMESKLAAKAGKRIELSLGSVISEASTHAHSLTQPFEKSPDYDEFLNDVANMVGIERPKDSWDAILELTYQRAFRRRMPLIAKEWAPASESHHQMTQTFSFSETPYRLIRRVSLDSPGTHQLKTAIGNFWAMGFHGSSIAMAVIYVSSPAIQFAVPKQRPFFEWLRLNWDGNAYAPFSVREHIMERMDDVIPFRFVDDYTYSDIPPVVSHIIPAKNYKLKTAHR